MTPADYDYLRKLVKERSGLVLSADKQYLVESRLQPVAHRAGLAGLSELVAKLKSARSETLVIEIAEAMTTNESFFFRDKLPFEQFRNTIMPALLATRSPHRPIRIWCAAAATGQEPYSLAISLKEMGDKIRGHEIEIVATEFASQVLEKAKSGLFSHFEVQRGLPIQLLVKYFNQVGDSWQITPDVRAMVQFRPFNLLHDFTHLGRFDLVFCRNVLIYFDQQTKTQVLDRVARIIEPDGYLVLGAAETVVGLTESFRPLPDHRGLYVPNPYRKGGSALDAPSRLLRLAMGAGAR